MKIAELSPLDEATQQYIIDVKCADRCGEVTEGISLNLGSAPADSGREGQCQRPAIVVSPKQFITWSEIPIEKREILIDAVEVTAVREANVALARHRNTNMQSICGEDYRRVANKCLIGP